MKPTTWDLPAREEACHLRPQKAFLSSPLLASLHVHLPLKQLPPSGSPRLSWHLFKIDCAQVGGALDAIAHARQAEPPARGLHSFTRGIFNLRISEKAACCPLSPTPQLRSENPGAGGLAPLCSQSRDSLSGPASPVTVHAEHRVRDGDSVARKVEPGQFLSCSWHESGMTSIPFAYINQETSILTLGQPVLIAVGLCNGANNRVTGSVRASHLPGAS